MGSFNFDVDIDFADKDKALECLKHVNAALSDGTKHNTGVYFQDIPCDPFDKVATIDYKLAETYGYFKVDFLNVGVYEGIDSEERLIELMKEPDWSLFREKEIVEQLFQIGSYYDLIQRYFPSSVEDLAMLLALIRPSKKHLVHRSKAHIMSVIWDKPEDGSYHFKKSHAISYAMVVVIQLNLIKEKLFD